MGSVRREGDGPWCVGETGGRGKKEEWRKGMPGYLLSPGTLCAAPPAALLGLRTPQPEPATPEPAGGCPNS